MEIINRQAKHNYYILEEIEAGIVLSGTEIKSIRKGNANIRDSYVRIKNNEAFIINMHVSPYLEGNIFNLDETRERKLLLHKKEIYKLRDRVRLDGLTLIPLKLYFSNDKAKILIGVCRGKKNYDKREALKKKDIERNIREKMKESVK